jgi:hypothetical protein
MIELWIGSLPLPWWVLPPAILIGVIYLFWTWHLLPHVGPAVALGLSNASEHEPKELNRIEGKADLLPGQRSIIGKARSIKNRPLNPDCVRYEWEPKSEVSADYWTMVFTLCAGNRRMIYPFLSTGN